MVLWMDSLRNMVQLADLVFRLAHRHLIWCLVACYCLGALCPSAGIWIRECEIEMPVFDGMSPSLLSVMLGLLLLNAGLGLDHEHLVHLRRNWRVLIVALVAGILLPLTYLLGLSWLLGGFDTATRLPLLLGIAVIAAMPTAGSSAAWSQNADGNMAMSLGLVLFSTLLSPLVAYGVLQFLTETMANQGGQATTKFASQMAATFLTLWVIVPALVGMLIRRLLGQARAKKLKHHVKLVNLINLLLLNYSNASLALPSLIEKPDPSLLVTAILISLGLAIVSFGAAVPISRVFREQRPERASLFFGLGMRNNGAGLVLVATVIPEPEIVLLPIILYNLIQHLGAGIVDRYVLEDVEEPSLIDSPADPKDRSRAR
jgi:bile acid:Na+ symporter, BASS family